MNRKQKVAVVVGAVVIVLLVLFPPWAEYAVSGDGRKVALADLDRAWFLTPPAARSEVYAGSTTEVRLDWSMQFVSVTLMALFTSFCVRLLGPRTSRSPE